MKSVTILGATGSIGQNALSVIAENKAHLKVFALTANSNYQLLFQQCMQWQPRYAVMVCAKQAKQLQELLREQRCATEVLVGENALQQVAADTDVDIVLAAIVGAAALQPTLAAITANKRVLLANKEALVMSGALFMQALRDSQAQLIPVDSEHNAILQCLPSGYQPGTELPENIARVQLTASGGPFRELPVEQLESVTPDQAVAHPNWKMGHKISVDSATMLNKGLEVAEAHWLFSLPIEQIEVIIHPQSIIHSLVQYIDGSSIAQMARHDMRVAIASAFSWPQRMSSGVQQLDLASIAQLDFEQVCMQRFPCLQLVYAAIRQGGCALTVLNAANEIAVAAFLQGKIKFTHIAQVIDMALDKCPTHTVNDIQHVLNIDQESRIHSEQIVSNICKQIVTI